MNLKCLSLVLVKIMVIKLVFKIQRPRLWVRIVTQVFDNNCFMMDRNTGNSFQCPCQDNSCNDAYNQMALGNCVNPYSSSNSQGSSGSSSS